MNALEKHNVEAPTEDTAKIADPAKPRARATPARVNPVPRTRRTAKSKKAAAARKGTKTAKMLALLQRPSGASLTELRKATGWQAHSVRGFLSGALKNKMGLRLASVKRDDGERAYRIPVK